MINSYVSTPGEIIMDELNARSISLFEFAQIIGLSDTQVVDLILGRYVIDESLAELLSRLLGTSKEFWLNLEKKHLTNTSK